MSNDKEEGTKATTLEDGESFIGSMVSISSEPKNDEVASSPPVSEDLNVDIIPGAPFAEEKSWDDGHQAGDGTGDPLSTSDKELIDRVTFTNPLHQPSREIDMPPGSRDSLVEPTWNTSTEHSVLETSGVKFLGATTTTTPPVEDHSYPLDSSDMASNWYPGVTSATMRSGRYPSLGDDAIFQKLHAQDSERLNESQNLLDPPTIEEKESLMTTAESENFEDANGVAKAVLNGQLSEPTESLDESETYYSVTHSEPCSPSTAGTRTSPKRSYAEWRQMVKGRPSPTARAVARKFTNSPSSSSGDLFPNIKLPFETNSAGDMNMTAMTDANSISATEISPAEKSSGNLVSIAVHNENPLPSSAISPVENPSDDLIATLEKLLEDQNDPLGAEQLSSHNPNTAETNSINVVPGAETPLFGSNATNAANLDKLLPHELSSMEIDSTTLVSSLETSSDVADPVATMDDLSGKETNDATRPSSHLPAVEIKSLTSVACESSVAISAINTELLSSSSNHIPSIDISNVETSISNHVESVGVPALSQATPLLDATATTLEERGWRDMEHAIQALCLGVPDSQHVESSMVGQHVEINNPLCSGVTVSTFTDPTDPDAAAATTKSDIAEPKSLQKHELAREVVEVAVEELEAPPPASSTVSATDSKLVDKLNLTSLAALGKGPSKAEGGRRIDLENVYTTHRMARSDDLMLEGTPSGLTSAPLLSVARDSSTPQQEESQLMTLSEAILQLENPSLPGELTATLRYEITTTVADEPDALGAGLRESTASTLEDNLVIIDSITKSQAQEQAVHSASRGSIDDPDLLEVEHNNPIVPAVEKECQDPPRAFDLTQTEPTGNAFVIQPKAPTESSPQPREAHVQEQVARSSLNQYIEDDLKTFSSTENVIDSKPEVLTMEMNMAVASIPKDSKELSVHSGSAIDSMEECSLPVLVNQTAPSGFIAAPSAAPFEDVKDRGVTESSQHAPPGVNKIPDVSLKDKAQLVGSLDLNTGHNGGDKSQAETVLQTETAQLVGSLDLHTGHNAGDKSQAETVLQTETAALATPKADDRQDSPAFFQESTKQGFLATATLSDEHEVDATTMQGRDVGSSQVSSSSNPFLLSLSAGMSQQRKEFGDEGRSLNDFQPEFGLSRQQLYAGTGKHEHDRSNFGQATFGIGQHQHDHGSFAYGMLDNNLEDIHSLAGGPAAVASNSSYEELPNPLSEESMTTTMGVELDERLVIGASINQNSSSPPGTSLGQTGLMVQNSSAHTSVHEPTLGGLGVIGKPVHPSESLSTQPRQNDRSDTIPLSFVPPYAIVGAQAQEIQANTKAKQEQDSTNQFSQSVGASANSYFSYHVAEQPHNLAVSLPRQLASSQRLDLRDQSFGPASSHRTVDAFAQVQPGESFGYSYESAKNSPLAEDDAPPPISHGWLPPVHDSKVGNVILVPRPGILDRPVNYTVPPQQMPNPYHPYPALAPPQVASGSGGRRKIKLKLQEDVKHQDVTRRSFFFRKKSVSGFGRESIAMNPVEASVDRGTITVSWYDGTTSLELQEHVRRSVIRKLGIDGNTRLRDIRILDESVDPPEEIVLSPFIPDGSRFLLRFSTKDEHESRDQGPQNDRWSERAPESPGASPSPYPSSNDLAGLNATQLALLASRWNPLTNPNVAGNGAHPGSFPAGILKNGSAAGAQTNAEVEDVADVKASALPKFDKAESKTNIEEGDASSKVSVADTDDDILSMQPDDVIEERLRKITELLLLDRRRRYSRRRQEKRQVIFVLANYFVLFLSLIAISAEIQARAPNWLAYLERELASVQQCATDQDALFNCVSNGDFAGLIASVILWLSRSASTKRIFLFGFKSPKQLWTVVYEALVTGVCWGFSYLFIRRAMNPETRKNYFQKYWKDAVYGSLAGFNAAFMKHVLKNLIPQERFEEALQQKQLNIFSWFPSVIKK